MAIYSAYGSMWTPNVEEWIAMLLAINILIQCVHLTNTQSKCECNEKYSRLLEVSIQNDTERMEEYNKLVDKFNENDETHVDDYNKLIDDNTALEAELLEKSSRITFLRKRIGRLESRLARISQNNA